MRKLAYIDAAVMAAILGGWCAGANAQIGGGSGVSGFPSFIPGDFEIGGELVATNILPVAGSGFGITNKTNHIKIFSRRDVELRTRDQDIQLNSGRDILFQNRSSSTTWGKINGTLVDFSYLPVFLNDDVDIGAADTGIQYDSGSGDLDFIRNTVNLLELESGHIALNGDATVSGDTLDIGTNNSGIRIDTGTGDIDIYRFGNKKVSFAAGTADFTDGNLARISVPKLDFGTVNTGLQFDSTNTEIDTEIGDTVEFTVRDDGATSDGGEVQRTGGNTTTIAGGYRCQDLGSGNGDDCISTYGGMTVNSTTGGNGSMKFGLPWNVTASPYNTVCFTTAMITSSNTNEMSLGAPDTSNNEITAFGGTQSAFNIECRRI